jgi:hypothetical protein
LVIRGAWLGLVFGCSTPEFLCQSSDECASGPDAGICEESGYCSFPDAACESGQRYGGLAGPFSGECTAPDEGTSTSSSSPTTVESASGVDEAGSMGGSITGSPADESSTAAISVGTNATDSDPTLDGSSTEPATDEGSTGGGTVDPYGSCRDGCTLPDAVCLSTNQGESVCASPCADPTNPEASCPVPLVAGHAVACASTQMGGGDFCVLLCLGDVCPGAMTCREGICVFEP